MDQDPRSFNYQKEQVTTLGPIQDVKIQIYSSEKKGTDNTDLPKYPDDPGEIFNLLLRHLLKSSHLSCSRMRQFHHEPQSPDHPYQNLQW